MSEEITTTRCKFRCDSVETFQYGETAKLSAVRDDATPENRRFAQASPGGKFEILVSNPAVRGFFKPGSDYYLDVTEAPKNVPA